jgi:hypothetical protein
LERRGLEAAPVNEVQKPEAWSPEPDRPRSAPEMKYLVPGAWYLKPVGTVRPEGRPVLTSTVRAV